MEELKWFSTLGVGGAMAGIMMVVWVKQNARLEALTERVITALERNAAAMERIIDQYGRDMRDVRRGVAGGND